MKRLLAMLMALLFMTSCGQPGKIEPAGGGGNDEPVTGQEENINNPNGAGIQDEPDEEPEPPKNIEVVFTAVGDNLVHNTLSIDSRVEGGHDFSHIYQGVAGYIQGSDIAFINQEVPLDGTEGAYPVLSAPREVADALVDIGFNVASLSNNHMADKGVKGLTDTIETLNNAGFEGVVGARASKDEIGNYVIIEKNGIKFGFLAYTYGLNSGLGGSSWMVDTISTEKITNDVNAIRPLCDFLAVSMHWGVEYGQEPSQGQQEFAQLLADLDVDLVIGSHPHVLQPAQWIDRPGKEQTLCIYSLGNFASGQREQDRLIGGILKLTLEFSPEHEFIGFKDAAIDGVITHYEKGNKGFALYMMDDYTPELAERHGLHNYDRPLTYDFFTQRIAGIKESLKR